LLVEKSSEAKTTTLAEVTELR